MRATRKTRGTIGTTMHLFVAAVLTLPQAAHAEDEVWPWLREALYGQRPIADAAGWLTLEAPYRAHDAALVPIDIVALRPQSKETYIETITLIVDQNPAPVAGVFHLTPDSGLASLSTRVRINAYSDVRAIAETNDGRLFMATRFVKATGGCSAPALKDQDEALANLGKMKLRQFAPAAEQPAQSLPVREAQIMIRHPNYSGLQVDQITQYYIPAHYVQDIEVRQGDSVILTVEGAISLSEDPSIRFHFLADGSPDLAVRATDTDGNAFSQTWSVEAAPGT